MKRLMTAAVATLALITGSASPVAAQEQPPPTVVDTRAVAYDALMREIQSGLDVPSAPLPEGAVDQGQVSVDFSNDVTTDALGTCSVSGRVFYNKATLFGVGVYFNLYVKAGFGCSAGVVACSTSFAVAAGVPPFGVGVGSGYPWFDQTYGCSTTTSPSQTGPIPNLAVVNNAAIAFDGTAIFPPQVVDIR